MHSISSLHSNSLFLLNISRTLLPQVLFPGLVIGIFLKLLTVGKPAFHLPLSKVVGPSGWLLPSNLYVFDNLNRRSPSNRKVPKTALTDIISPGSLPFHTAGMHWVFGLGAEDGGAGVHAHGDAWLALLPDSAGEKVWFWWQSLAQVPDLLLKALHNIMRLFEQ